MPRFLEFFETLPDPRVERTKRHKLADIVFITIAAVLSGCDDWNDIEFYGQSKQSWLSHYIELPNGIPSHDTFNRVFAALDPLALQQCFLTWVQSIATHSQGNIVSIDGKRLCGSGSNGSKSIVHMVSAWSSANALVLAQYKVDDKSNEITAIPSLLEVLELKGCIVTIDAMGCQKEIAEAIVDKGADYILAVKGNQQFLLDDIREAFTQSKASSEDQQLSVDHGRVEKRICRTIAGSDWVCKAEQWKGLKTLVEITAYRTDKSTGETASEVRYYISSLNGEALLFNKAIRAHWGIENGLHWTLDVVFSEDQSHKRAGQAAQNFSIVNRIALNLFKADKSVKLSMKSKRHKAAWENDYITHFTSVALLRA